MQLPSWITGILPIVLLAGSGVVGYVNLERDVSDNASAIVSVNSNQAAKWVEHADYHREKALENAGTFTRIDGRIGALEQVPPKVDQIGYRVTVVEQQAVNTANAIKELQMAVNSQGADLRIALEILRRMDEKAADKARQQSERKFPPT